MRTALIAALVVTAIGCDRARTEPTARPETERAAPRHLRVGDRVVMRDVRDIAGPWVVDAGGVVWRIDGNHRRRVVDRARRVVTHPDGPLVVREGAEPGRTSLWLGGRALAPSTAGADDLPFVLPDGRVVFVSTRTTVASVWILYALDAPPRQLTNVGLVAGRPLDGFVPPPVDGFELVGGHLEWDAGDGRRIRLPEAP